MVNPYAEYIKKRFDVVEMAGSRAAGRDIAELASRGRVHLEGFDLSGLGQFDAYGSMAVSSPAPQPWWQGLISRVTDIVAQRIGPAPGTFQQTGPGGTTIIRQPSGSTAPFPTPTSVTGTFSAGTGLILAAVGVGVLVLVMSRR